MNWDDLPSADEVHAAIHDVVKLKARLRIAELELEIAQSEIAERAQENRAARVIGVDEASRENLKGLQYAVLNLKEQLEAAEATVAFNKHRLDVIRSLSFRR